MLHVLEMIYVQTVQGCKINIIDKHPLDPNDLIQLATFDFPVLRIFTQKKCLQ